MGLIFPLLLLREDTNKGREIKEAVVRVYLLYRVLLQLFLTVFIRGVKMSE